MDKVLLRKQYLCVRDSLDLNNRLKQETYLNQELYQLIKTRGVHTCGLYLPIKSEVNIYPLIKRLGEDNIKLFAPVILVGAHMVFRRYNPLALKEGAYHILEPQSLEECESCEMIIVPAVCVNKAGYRIGYGKGYYDRYLKEHPAFTVVPIFRELIIDEDFQGDYDIKIDKILSQ